MRIRHARQRQRATHAAAATDCVETFLSLSLFGLSRVAHFNFDQLQQAVAVAAAARGVLSKGVNFSLHFFSPTLDEVSPFFERRGWQGCGNKQPPLMSAACSMSSAHFFLFSAWLRQKNRYIINSRSLAASELVTSICHRLF